MTHARTPLLLAALVTLAPACGTFSDTSATGDSETGSGSGTGSATDTPTGGGGETVTVYDIQQGKVTDKVVVELKNVVVTSPVFYDKKANGNLFIAEAAGGPFSGIQVYIYADTALELDAMGGLPKVGDTIDLRAMYTEFYDASQLTVGAASDLTITGTGTVPAPSVVKAADITTGGAKAEDYEGCLVQIDGAKVTAPVVMYGEFEVDGALKVDDLFFVPSPGPKPPVDTTFTSLVGQMTYSFDEFKLAPRSCADYQGWADCSDPVDPTADPTTDPTGGNVAATIYDIQMGTVPDKTYVDVKDVVVTSPFFTDAKMNGNFFIAEAGGGEYSGIQVYVFADTAAELMTANKIPKVGDKITISGQYTEFYEYSELTLSKADNLTITGTAPVPAADVVDPADIATGGSKSENYEGCLVEVQNVTVTKPVAMYGEFSVTGDLVVDDLFFAPDPGPNPAMGKMYSSITGQLAFSFDVFKLSPRSLADLVD